MSVVLMPGDCLEVLEGIPENSVDAVVTDPPYELGFMGKSWDASGVSFRPETWAKALRVMKPGAHLAAFGAPKNYHRLAVAIEDAGFEIRDCLQWVFGSGFPKSHNLDGEWQGWGTALKPAYEPIVLARKPLSEKTVAANVLRWGTGALNIDACRIAAGDDHKANCSRDNVSGIWREHGSIKGVTTQASPLGRWPANLAHDGSEEVVALFPETAPSKPGVRNNSNKGHEGWSGGTFRSGPLYSSHSDSGSAARFFYCAKASKADRAGSKHPTVKPVALMRWLVRMVTPPGGVVLDQFAGSGTTGQAAVDEGFTAWLIEREEEYQEGIKRRLALA